MENLKIRIFRFMFCVIIVLCALGDSLLWLCENWEITLPLLIVLVLLLITVNKIRRTRKEKKNNAPVKLSKKILKKYPIIIQYIPPKGINSAEAGLLYNGRVEPTDLTSLLYQRAYEGFIQIDNGSDSENISKIILKKIKDLPEDRPFFEKNMFNCIFIGGTDTKIISSSNQLKYALFLEDLRTHGISKGRFEKVKVPLLGYIYGYEKFQLTDKGAELVSHIIGYRNYINSCDENKIKLLLKEDPLFIDRTLPYVTAFGLETEFLKKVSPLIKDRNAKYLFGEKILPLSDILSGAAVKSASKLFDLYRIIKFLDQFNPFRLFFKF